MISAIAIFWLHPTLTTTKGRLRYRNLAWIKLLGERLGNITEQQQRVGTISLRKMAKYIAFVTATPRAMLT
jgi:hypothetical protein